MNILVLNGPNLNLLGTRDPEVYGSATLKDIEHLLAGRFPSHTFTFFQSNHEGELIEQLQKAGRQFQGIVANWGGYTHTSVAIRDAVDVISTPVVEVHISNIHAREEFRERSVTGSVCIGIITGFGTDSYVLGVQALELNNSKT